MENVSRIFMEAEQASAVLKRIRSQKVVPMDAFVQICAFERRMAEREALKKERRAQVTSKLLTLGRYVLWLLTLTAMITLIAATLSNPPF